MKKKNLDGLAEVLMVVGALNWGFVGLVGLNFVDSILGSNPAIEQFVYILVGLSGLYWLWNKLAKK